MSALEPSPGGFTRLLIIDNEHCRRLGTGRHATTSKTTHPGATIGASSSARRDGHVLPLRALFVRAPSKERWAPKDCPPNFQSCRLRHHMATAPLQPPRSHVAVFNGVVRRTSHASPSLLRSSRLILILSTIFFIGSVWRCEASSFRPTSCDGCATATAQELQTSASQSAVGRHHMYHCASARRLCCAYSMEVTVSRASPWRIVASCHTALACRAFRPGGPAAEGSPHGSALPGPAPVLVSTIGVATPGSTVTVVLNSSVPFRHASLRRKADGVMIVDQGTQRRNFYVASTLRAFDLHPTDY